MVAGGVEREFSSNEGSMSWDTIKRKPTDVAIIRKPAPIQIQILTCPCGRPVLSVDGRKLGHSKVDACGVPVRMAGYFSISREQLAEILAPQAEVAA